MAIMPKTIRNQDLSTIMSVFYNLAGERGYGLHRQLLEALPDQALYDKNGIKIDILVDKSSHPKSVKTLSETLYFNMWF